MDDNFPSTSFELIEMLERDNPPISPLEVLRSVDDKDGRVNLIARAAIRNLIDHLKLRQEAHRNA